MATYRRFAAVLKMIAKPVIGAVYLRPGAARRIWIGPLRGMTYRVGPITGMAPWYSGADRELQRRFHQLVRPGECVIDVGANWGLHTLYLSRLIGPSGRVLAVECYPPAVADLEWHVAANQCDNVRIVKAALSDHDGQAAFAPGRAPTTGQLLADETVPSGSDQFIVRTRSLDSIVEELAPTPPVLVKIDVEGAEGRVLCGSEQTLNRCRPLFLIELHTPEQDLFVSRWLREHRYSLERLTPPPIRHFDKGWPDRDGVWGTILAKPVE